MKKKKRIELDDEHYDELLLLAKKLGIANKDGDKRAIVTELLSGVFINKHEELKSENEKLNQSNQELAENSNELDEVVTKRLRKLNVLDILEGNLSKNLTTLLDSFTENNKDAIQKAVESL